MDIGFFVYKFRYCWKSATRHLRSDEQLGTSSAGAKLTINFAMLALKRHHTGGGGGGGDLGRGCGLTLILRNRVSTL